MTRTTKPTTSEERDERRNDFCDGTAPRGSFEHRLLDDIDDRDAVIEDLRASQLVASSERRLVLARVKAICPEHGVVEALSAYYCSCCHKVIAAPHDPPRPSPPKEDGRS